MQKKVRYKETDFLRSEKVRGIVSKPPPFTTRFGLAIIILILLATFFFASNVPYNRTITAAITIRQIDSISLSNDSVLIQVFLKLTQDFRYLNEIKEFTLIEIQEGGIRGEITSLSQKKNSIEHQEGCCVFHKNDIFKLEKNYYTAKLIKQESSFISRLTSRIKTNLFPY